MTDKKLTTEEKQLSAQEKWKDRIEMYESSESISSRPARGLPIVMDQSGDYHWLNRKARRKLVKEERHARKRKA